MQMRNRIGRKSKMSKTKISNRAITAALILLLTLSILSVINININIFEIPTVHGADISVSTSASVLHVNTTHWSNITGIYASSTPINHAIGNASQGYTLNVTDGTYNSTNTNFPIWISVASLTIESAGTAEETIINASDAGVGIYINANNVTVDGFTIRPGSASGIYIIYHANATVQNNIFNSTECRIGVGTISTKIATEATVSGNEFENCTIYLDQYITNFTVSGNTLTAGAKIILDGNNNNTVISGNEITGNNVDGQGIHFLGQSISDGVVVQGNTIYNNEGPGIAIDSLLAGWNYAPENLVIKENNITGNEIGINITLWHNTNSIYHNNIYNNRVYGVKNTNDTSVNATLNWWGDASGPGYTGGVGGLGTGNNVSDNVQYIPWLNAAYPGGVSTTPFSITPTATKGNVRKWFNITVQNIGSPAAVDYVNVTYPSSFTLHTYKYATGWTQSHDATGKTVTFTATGGCDLDIGETARFDFQMTTSTSVDDFKILCKNLMGGKGYQNLTIAVDSTPPTVTIPALPTIYSVGAGNKIWINGTIWDDTYNTPSLAINDTTHFPLNPQVLTYNESATEYTWYFRFYNTSAIPDGHLGVNITGTDAAGNVETGGNVVSTTIDNTAPTLISLVVRDNQIGNLTRTGDTFYMSATATGLNFTVMFTELHPSTNVTYISNYTVTTTEYFTNNTWFYSGADAWYNVTGVNTVTINNITITDLAQPNNNTLVAGPYTIIRDQEGPTTPTYTVTEICGALIIKNLNSTDNVEVQKYEVYVNGSSFLNVTVTKLANTTLDWITPPAALNASCVFDGTLVLNLTNYAGGLANLTIRALDVGGNPSNFSTPHVYTISEGRWYPAQLQPEWNLIGLPLIPASTARADVLSLILKQGATGVIVYGYNNATDQWILNPATMEDGRGYWIYMTAYDVMIVSGRIVPPPPSLPPNYYLTAGWVLADFKSIKAMNVSQYLSSLPTASYFTYIYVFDAATQTWSMKSGGDMLQPGWGFWIFMYSDQTLIPPILDP